MPTSANYKVEEHIVRQFAFNNLDAIVFAGLDGVVRYANPSAEKMYGYDSGELLNKHVDIFNSHETHNTQEIIDAIISKGGWSGEIIQAKKTGESFHAFLSVTLIFDKGNNPIGYSSNSHEITKRIEDEKQLKQALVEKEILLSEIHHRVKNNLAMVSSIFQLQKLNVSNKELENILTDCQNRIKSTAIVHEMLYQNESLSQIELSEYIKCLVKEIGDSYGDNRAVISVSIPEYKTDLEQAIPFGLIVTELVSNAIKHGFSNKKGEIKVIVVKQDDNSYTLTVEDNGKGLPHDFNLDSESSTGITLVKTFAEQLDGVFEIESHTPARFAIKFACQ